MPVLKGSDDGVSQSELLSFWIFSIVRYSRKKKTQRFGKLDLFPFSDVSPHTPEDGNIQFPKLNFFIC
jgi:hypothetical protein